MVHRQTTQYNISMPKNRTHYVCQECGRTSPKDMGRCPGCGAWNSMLEEMVTLPASKSKHAARGLTSNSSPHRLSEISEDVETRLPLGIGEFARVLGGGVVPGSIVLIGGDPGIGKSTLVLQATLEMAHQNPVLYVSGEEFEQQIKMPRPASAARWW